MRIVVSKFGEVSEEEIGNVIEVIEECYRRLAPKLAKVANDMVEKAGGKMQTLYTLGKCDFISIIELPKEDDIMAILLCLGSMGNVRTTTMKAWSESEVAKMLATPHP